MSLHRIHVLLFASPRLRGPQGCIWGWICAWVQRPACLERTSRGDGPQYRAAASLHLRQCDELRCWHIHQRARRASMGTGLIWSRMHQRGRLAKQTAPKLAAPRAGELQDMSYFPCSDAFPFVLIGAALYFLKRWPGFAMQEKTLAERSRIEP